MSSNLVVSEEDAFSLILYMLTAAELHVSEPAIYGTLRLLIASGRLMDAMLKHLPPDQRDPYETWKSQVDENHELIMSDRDEYVRFLKTMTRQAASELKSRPSSGPHRG